MEHSQHTVLEAAAYITALVPALPSIGLVLGSGLGEYAEGLPQQTVLSSSAIPHYPSATVEGHKGRLIFAELRPGLHVVAFQGRKHFYESGSVDAVLFPVRIAAALGVKTLIITNAAGGIARDFSAGDLMVITDQINLTGERASEPVPPQGKQRAVPVYDPSLVDYALLTAERLGIPVQKGVYACVKGPSYETAAEVEMIRRIGGDAVGMSTVLEAQSAVALGMRVLGFSCITNKATGITAERLNHAEVTDVAVHVRDRFSRLLTGLLANIPAGT